MHRLALIAIGLTLVSPPVPIAATEPLLAGEEGPSVAAEPPESPMPAPESSEPRATTTEREGPVDEASSILDTVTVTASRLPGVVSEIPTAISTLEPRELQKQLILSTDLLKALDVRVPGLNVSIGSRTQCLTRIRGRRPSFQVNGVPANQDLRPSNCNSAYQVSPLAVEEVEVVRGGTALFGAGSPGGIVNLITRQATSAELEVDLVLQSGVNTSDSSDTGASDLYLGAGQRLERFDYYLGFGYQDYQGARDPDGNFIPSTAFDSTAFNAAGGYRFNDELRLRFSGTWYREDPGQEYNVDGAEVAAGVPFPRVIPVESNPFRDQGSDRQTTFSLSLEDDRLLGHQLGATLFFQEQEFQQRANFQDFNGGQPDFFNDDRENQTLGLRLTLARYFELGQSFLGLEYGLDHQRNRLLRLLLDSQDPGLVVGFIAPEVILDTTGVFVQGDLSFDRVRFTAGVRQEYYSGEIGDERAGEGLSGEGTPGDFDDADLLMVNAGVIYELTPRFQLYASFTQGAELTQLGRAARRSRNPELISPEPAISDQYEVGTRGRLGAVEVTFAAFYSESEAASLVQPDPSCAGESFCPLIPLRVPQEVEGLEGTLSWRIDREWELGSVFTWQEGEIFNQELGGFVPFGADAVSPTRLTGYTTWRPTRALALQAQATWIAETSFFTPSQREFGFIDTEEVFLVDLGGSFEIPTGAITLGISNLLDESYQNVTLTAAGFTPTLAEGRRITLGYRARF